MKYIKKSLISIVIVLFVASVALWVMIRNTTPEIINSIITEHLTILTDKQSQIKGTVTWQLLPIPGIKITNIQVGTPDKNEDYSLVINNMLLTLQLPPLLRGQLHFHDVNIDGAKLVVHANTAKSASPNYDKWINQTKIEQKTRIELHIGRVLLNHGQIHVLSDNTNSHITQLKLAVEPYNHQQNAFPMQLKANLDATALNNKLSTQISYNGHMGFTQDNSKGFIPKLSGQLQLKNTFLNALFINKMNANIKTVGQKTQLNPLTISLYQGESIGDIHYDHAQNMISISQTASRLDGKSLLTDLLGHERFQGKMDYSIQAEFPFDATAFEKLTGKGSITLKEGLLKDINTSQFILELKSQILTHLADNKIDSKTNAESLPLDAKESKNNNMPFKFATMQFKIQEEHLISDSLLLQADALDVKGALDLQLRTLKVNGNLQVNIMDKSQDDILSFLHGYFPITLSGTLDKLELTPNLKTLRVPLKQTGNKPQNNSLKRTLKS
jgi:AsmA protein